MNISKPQKSGHALIALVGTALTMALAAPVLAQGVVVGPDVAVHYSADVIAKERGAANLLRRIESAARRVCAPLDHGDVASRANAKECIAKVTDAAVQQVNHPMLLAMYNSKRGITSPVASLTK